MKSMIAKVSAALVFVSIATSASAQVYGEVVYLGLNFEETTFGVDADVGALGVNVGYEINKNLAVEGLVAVGVNDDTVSVLGASLNVDPKHVIGVFLKPKANLGENFEVYAKLGWADTEVEFSGPGGTATGSDSDFAYGIGAQFNVSPKAYVSAGYLKLNDEDSVTIDGWSISVGYKF